MRVIYSILLQMCWLSPLVTAAQQQLASTVNPETRAEVPVICFHHIYKEALRPNELTISADAFQADMKILYDSGYHSISPAQLHDYYTTGKPLPPKPFMITFDDGNLDQWDNGIKVLDQYNFKAVFFIMTVTVGKKNYLDENQIRLLSQWEHSIGCHTWDHQAATSLKSKDFPWQIEKPKDYLEKLTGVPVISFAYPYGKWNENLIPQLKQSGFKLAFQLTDKTSQRYPLYTVRRLMVSGKWSPNTFLMLMKNTFHKETDTQLLNPNLQ